MDWSEGYGTEEYTFGYFPALSPGLLRLNCLSAGLAPPACDELRYLELGFGQGLSINMHAAAVPGDFWGTDFNPTQAAFARTLAQAAGSGAVLLNDSFAEFAARKEVPDFDIIVLHGIFTWVSDENRRHIIDIVKRKLRVGGLFYVSYNCLPGWGATAPLRHLINLYGELASADAGGLAGKLDAGMKFTQKVIDAGALYFRNTPGAARKLQQMVGGDLHYLSHEYFTSDWHLMNFSDVARMLDEAKLTFAASARTLNHIDKLNVPLEGEKLLAQIKHPILRESVRDYLVNEQFRSDIFVKGPRRLTYSERLDMILGQKFVLIRDPENIPMQVPGALGMAVLHEPHYRPLLEVLAEDNFAPKTLRYLADHSKLKFIEIQYLFQLLLVLVGAEHARPAQEVTDQSRQRCRALNRYICECARSSEKIRFLVSPIAGCGIPVARTEQLLLLAAQLGKETASEKAAYIWELLSAQGDNLVEEGKNLQTPEENIVALTRIAKGFAEKRLHILKALEVA